MVLARPGVDDELGGAPCAARPVCRQNHQLCAQQFQRPRRFREAGVIADVDADATERQRDYIEGPVARRQETINAEEGQVDFTVTADDARWPDHHCGIVITIALALDEADDHVEAGFAAGRGDGLH